MADSHAEIKKATQLYVKIGIILFVFTGVTVAVATQPWLDFGEHGFDHVDAIIGLAIATFKATLVALIFMHLNHEKKWIYWLFGFGLIGAAALMLLVALAEGDPIHYEDFSTGEPKTALGQ